jgi:dTMP kinase
MVHDLNKRAIGDVLPDMTILIDLGAEARRNRLGKRHEDGQKDRLDVESEAFKRRVCDGFLAIAEEEPDRVFRIESQDKKEDTARLIREQVRRILL